MPKRYVVQENDTMYDIVARECPGSPLRETVMQVAADNKLRNPGLIYVGQVLILNCVDGDIPEPPDEPQTYTVEPGDTLIGIAAKFREDCPTLTWRTIARDNEIAGPDYILEVGQELVINCTGATAGSGGANVDVVTQDTVILDVPYYSQNDADSNLSSSDCGPACVRMVIGWNRIRQDQPDDPGPTVNALWTMTGKPPGGLVLINHLPALAEPFGITLKVQKSQTATTDWVIDQLDDGYPVIMLCHYGTIKPPHSAYTKGHFIVVIGFSPDEVYFHDPNAWGTPYRKVSRAVFNQAIGQDNWQDGNQPYQGLYVDH